MERETKTITTPGGDVVVVKTYLTGGEYRQIESVFYKDVEFVPGEQTNLSGSAITKAEDALIECSVVSIGGKTENIVQEVLNLRKPDYDFVIAELNEIKTGPEGKKKPQ